MSPDFTVRPMISGDMAGVLELLRLSLGTGTVPRSEAFWRWKHEQNPFGPSPVLVAVTEGRLVGLRAFLPWEWARDGDVVRSVRAVDTATHPEFRGRGIFRGLTLELVDRVAQDGVKFVFNTPNRVSRAGYLSMGWVDGGRVPLRLRPQRPSRLLAAAVGRIRGARPALRLPDGGLVDADGRSAGELAGSGLLDVFEYGPSSQKAHRFVTRRSPAYMRWRYVGIPELAYEAAWSSPGQPPAAIIYQKRTRGGILELRVCEVLLSPDPEADSEAVRLLVALRRTTAADLVAAGAGPTARVERVLVRAGLYRLPAVGPRLTVRATSEQQACGLPSSQSDFAFSIGDLELF